MPKPPKPKPVKATQPIVQPAPKKAPRPDPGVKSKLGQRGSRGTDKG